MCGFDAVFYLGKVILQLMLFLRSIALTQFKNYSHQRFTFDAPIVAITGANGIGKTNLLDAIYYLCFTKSYFAGSDAALVAVAQALEKVS